MNSPERTEDQVLGTSVKVIKDFLMECVNLPDHMHGTIIPSRSTPYARYTDDSPHFDRWLRKWQRLFTFQTEDIDGKWQAMEIPREALEPFVPKLRIALCRVWKEPDTRQRDWYFYRLRDTYHRMIVRAENPNLLDFSEESLKQFEKLSRDRGDSPRQKARLLERMLGEDLLEYAPRICPFESAVYWLQVNQNLMVYCEGPTCAAPYFFREGKGQKYCSPECADPARREAKLKWWNENRRTTVKNKARKSSR